MAQVYPKIEYRKTYEFTINDVKFGPLPKNTLDELFSDGRTASFFMERCLVIWFPKLKFASSKGYDFINESEKEGSNKRYIDQKGFTKRGGNFAPSTMIGAGRQVDEAAFQAHAKHTSYVFTDITSFVPGRKIYVCFWTGEDLIRTFGSNKIRASLRDKLFP
jgi:hypothetical protein